MTDCSRWELQDQRPSIDGLVYKKSSSQRVPPLMPSGGNGLAAAQHVMPIAVTVDE